MSTATEFLNQSSQLPPETVEQASEKNSSNWAILKFAPIYEWISLGILTSMMIIVGWSVELAGWGDLPSVIPTLVIGTITAFVISRLSIHPFLVSILVILLGILIVIWQASAQAVGDNPITRAIDSVVRMVSWVNVAQSGGISTDTIPFALMFMTAAWVVGYTVTSLTLRFRIPWLPTVLLSLVILTNLSYRHGEHEHTFFLFLIAGIVLFAHLTTVRRFETWRAEGIRYPRYLGWTTVQDGLVFAIPIVVVSMFLPLWEPRSDQLEDTWDVIRTPFYALRDPANRLLGGVNSPLKGNLLSIPSQSRAFGGPLELTDEPLMAVRSKYVVPYASRIYQRYTSAGWMTDPNTRVKAISGASLAPLVDNLEREQVSQEYVPLMDTKVVVPAGDIFSVDRAANYELLRPMKWQVPLSASADELSGIPVDLRDLLTSLQSSLDDLVPIRPDEISSARKYEMVEQKLLERVLKGLMAASSSSEGQIITRTVEDEVGRKNILETVLLPVKSGDENLNWNTFSVGIASDRQTGVVRWLELERKPVVEQVGVQLVEEISKDDTFSVKTFISHAKNEQLNDAGTDYPIAITDRYLQLPASLPIEVKSLADQIVKDAGATTPFEKSEAVKAFLTNQEYSLEIKGPDFGVDGIYYFLFQTPSEPCASNRENCDADKIKGYSQYFGSAAAVLLRSVGIPARYVAGWGPGEYLSEEEIFLIRDNDRHGWSQVYFPGYGWIDYEVTPGRPTIGRGQMPGAPRNNGGLGPGAVDSFEEDPDYLAYLLDLEELEQFELDARNLPGRSGLTGETTTINALRPYLVIGAITLLALIPILSWNLSLRGLNAQAQPYAKIGRIASLVGMKRKPEETIAEFIKTLSDKVPDSKENLNFIGRTYEQNVYANPDKTQSIEQTELERLNRAWRQSARKLIIHRARNFIRI